MKLMSILVCGLLGVGSTAQAETLLWKTEPALSSMEELPGCDPETDADCPDRVAHVGHSRYGVNMYLTYIEAVRAQIGFGTQPNAATMFLADQMHDGAFDWGGREVGGAFKPVVVIKRFYVMNPDTVAADKGKTELLVFRLKQDGTSCVEPGGEPTADNATARKLAEAAVDQPECLNSP